MSEECQGNPKKQTYLLECRPYVDYISKKVCIADPMQTMQTVFVTLDLLDTVARHNPGG